MKDSKVPGTVGFHMEVSPATLEKLKGDTMLAGVDAVMPLARNEAITMCAIHSGRPVALHIIVTAEPLTDSAGTVLETRAGAIDPGLSRLG